MPLYIYNCEKCRTLYEVLVPLKKLKKKVTCPKPKCNTTLKRELSAPAFSIH
jgi:putative FmdB family regulatory protein